MPQRPWYPRYPSDYLSDTAMLSLEAHGLYGLLLDYYWINGGPLPDDEAKLAKLCRLDRRHFRRTFAELLPNFSRTSGLIHNKRMDREIAQAIERSKKSSKAARKRWDADAIPPQPQPHKELSTNVDSRQNRVSTPIQKIIDLYHEKLPDLPRLVKRTAQRDATIRARWKEYPDLESFENFFAHVARSRFLTGGVTGRDGRAFKASLDWLMKADNFAKVLEGKYAD